MSLKTQTRKQKQKNPNWKPDETNKQKMLETRKLKAGRTEPEHKNGGGDSRSNTGLVRPDYYGPTRLSGSREASAAPGVAASATATEANSQPQGAPGQGGGRGGRHIKIAFMNLCCSTNRWNGLGTRITEKLLRAKQKWNKLRKKATEQSRVFACHKV